MNIKIITQAMETINNNFVGSVNMPVVKMTSEDLIANLPKQLNTFTTIIAILFLVVSVTGSIVRITKFKKGFWFEHLKFFNRNQSRKGSE